MADRHTNRDVRGRFVSTRNTRESGTGKFETYTEMPVEIEGADPADLAYDSVLRHAPEADDLAQGGQSSPLRARNPVLVHADDVDHPVFGRQAAVLRSAARDSRQMDPTLALINPMSARGTRLMGVLREEDGSDG